MPFSDDVELNLKTNTGNQVANLLQGDKGITVGQQSPIVAQLNAPVATTLASLGNDHKYQLEPISVTYRPGSTIYTGEKTSFLVAFQLICLIFSSPCFCKKCFKTKFSTNSKPKIDENSYLISIFMITLSFKNFHNKEMHFPLKSLNSVTCVASVCWIIHKCVQVS